VNRQVTVARAQAHQCFGGRRLNLLGGQVAVDVIAIRRRAPDNANAGMALTQDVNRCVFQAVIAPGSRDKGPIQNAHSTVLSILSGASGRATMIRRWVLLVYGQHVTSVKRSSSVG
jgi:hypothetical protein